MCYKCIIVVVLFVLHLCAYSIGSVSSQQFLPDSQHPFFYKIPFVKHVELISHTHTLDGMPLLKIYNCEAMEDNVHCFQELKCILHDTEANLFVDKFTTHSEFCDIWRKSYKTYLSTSTKNVLAAKLENKIQHLKYIGSHNGFTFATHFNHHKTYHHAMLVFVKNTDCTRPYTRVCHFLSAIVDHLLTNAKLPLDAYHE